MPLPTTFLRPAGDLELSRSELSQTSQLETTAQQLDALLRRLLSAGKNTPTFAPVFREQAAGLLDALEAALASTPPPKTEAGKEALAQVPRQLHFLEERMAAAEVQLAESRRPSGATSAKMTIEDPALAAREMAVAAHVLQRPVVAKLDGHYLVAQDGVDAAHIVEDWQAAQQLQTTSALLDRTTKVAEASDALVHDAQAQPRLLSDVLHTFTNTSVSPPQLYRAWVEKYVPSHVRHPEEMRELLDFLMRTAPPELRRERLAAVLIGANALSPEHRQAWAAAVTDVAREAGLALYDGALFPPPQAEPRPLAELLAACRSGDPDAARRADTQDAGNALLMGALKLTHPAEIALAAKYLVEQHRYEAHGANVAQPAGEWESRQHALLILHQWIDLGCAAEPKLWREALAARGGR